MYKHPKDIAQIIASGLCIRWHRVDVSGDGIWWACPCPEPSPEQTDPESPEWSDSVVFVAQISATEYLMTSCPNLEPYQFRHLTPFVGDVSRSVRATVRAVIDAVANR